MIISLYSLTKAMQPKRLSFHSTNQGILINLAEQPHITAVFILHLPSAIVVVVLLEANQ